MVIRDAFIMHKVRQNYYFNGCKPSKLLALKLKQSESWAAINSICTASGVSTNPKDSNAMQCIHNCSSPTLILTTFS